MHIYFARHGQSEANVLRVISNRGYQHPLTEQGRQQARALADALRAVPLTHIYTSPLLRAVETAQIVASSQGLTYLIADALREYDCGILEGRADPQAWAQYETTWRDWLERGQPDSHPPGGESFHDLRARFVPFINQLVQQHSGTPARLLLIGHGGVYRAMLPLVLSAIDTAFAVAHPLGNAAYVLAEEQQGQLICREWGGQAPG
jgi:probable phosphoglycerate mutase